MFSHLAESVGLWLLGKLLQWAIGNVWHIVGHCVICNDTDKVFKNPLCSACAGGINQLCKQELFTHE